MPNRRPDGKDRNCKKLEIRNTITIMKTIMITITIVMLYKSQMLLLGAFAI